MRGWAGLVVAVAALVASAPTPGATAHELAHPSAADPIACLVAAIALTAWALAGWLLLAAAATAGGRLPGVAGRAAVAVSRRIAPAAVRRVLEATLGLAVATSALGAGPAAAADTTPPAPSPAAELSLDWPGTPSPPALDWAAPVAPVASATPAAPTGPSTPTRPVEPVVVVRPGDSLWSIAAHHSVAPSPAVVARSWPRWWSANRAVIGSDPDLIRPGTRLVPPAR